MYFISSSFELTSINVTIPIGYSTLVENLGLHICWFDWQKYLKLREAYFLETMLEHVYI